MFDTRRRPTPLREREPVGTTGEAAPGDDRFARLAMWVAIAFAVLPVLIAVARAVHDRWLPVGENALFQIRARDVFSRHPPLIGLASSGSENTQVDLHHPGPLFFDLLASPVRVWDGTGVALGVAAMNLAAVITAMIVAWRRRGAYGVITAAAIASALLWTMGSELLFDPWNPNSMMLPFFAVLFLAWGVGSGDAVLLPFLAAAGSLVLQTHLSYAFLVPALVLTAAVAFVLGRRRATVEERVPPRRLRWALIATAVVVVVAWAQPVAQQFGNDGEGNLGNLVTSARAAGGTETLGASNATRLVASVLTLPPFWFRSSYRTGWLASPDAVFAQPDFPSTIASGLTLLTLVAVLVLCFFVARRRHDAANIVLVVVGGVAFAVAFASAVNAPIGVLGVPLHFFRWLWVIGAFLAFVVLFTVGAAVVAKPRGRRWFVGACLAATVVLSVATWPKSDQGVVPPPYAIAPLRDLRHQLDGFTAAGTVFVEMPRGFNEPYGEGVLALLQQHDVPFVVRHEWTRQVGSQREFTGDNADQTMFVIVGPSGGRVPAGARVVASHDPLSAAQHAELARLRDDIVAPLVVDDGTYDNLLTDDVDAPQRAEVEAARGDVDAARGLLARGVLARLARDGGIADRSFRDVVLRYDQLNTIAQHETVTLAVRPG